MVMTALAVDSVNIAIADRRRGHLNDDLFLKSRDTHATNKIMYIPV